METKKSFKERRSVNHFDKNKSVSEELLKDIINTAVLAPSAFNLQPWRIIAAKTDLGKQRLFELANKQTKVLDAPVVLIVIGDKNGFADDNPVWEEMLQSVGGKVEIVTGSKQAAAYLYGSTEERKLKFAESNAGLLAMSLMITAKDLGVDSHPMSGINFDGIHKEFGLKDSETAVILVCLGYLDSSKHSHPRRSRRLFEEIATIV